MINNPIKLKPGSTVKILGRKLVVHDSLPHAVWFEGGVRIQVNSPHWEDATLQRPPLPAYLGGHSRPDSLFNLNKNGNYDPSFVGSDELDFTRLRLIFNRPPDGLLEDLKLAVEQLEEALANE